MRSLSPLRYPGGKGELFKYFTKVIRLNSLEGCKYYEPFAGGAGCALRLLESRIVGQIELNDADPCIYSFWNALINESKMFIDLISTIKISLKEWTRQKDIINNYKNYSRFQVGFAVFYINRCSRSGILLKSGPIGGYTQKGNWKIDARFNRDSLIRRINKINEMKDNIKIYNMDGLSFIKSKLVNKNVEKKFFYMDPPYINAGGRLYFNSFSEKDHRCLANYIQRHSKLKWLITYDANDFIKNIYSRSRRYELRLHHSLQIKRKAVEYVFAGNNVEMPKKYQFNSKCIVAAL